MIERIKVHNQLNGFRFSVIEFGIFILLIAPFAGYYLIHARWLFAVISLGIMLNGIPIVLYGMQALRDHVPSGRQQALLDPQQRALIHQSHPRLLGDTLLIVVSILLPFVHVGWVMAEWAIRTRQARQVQKIHAFHLPNED